MGNLLEVPDMKQQHGRELTAPEMVQMLDEFVNEHDSPEARREFAEQVVFRTHRTLQQSIMRFILATLELWADPKTDHDLRNEATVKLARKFLEAVPDRHLPLV
jgi:hypothetical protein